MPAELMTTPPIELRAGDTATWRRTLADYPASAGWQLKYALVGQAGAYSFTAAADGDDHVVTVLPATTATWVAGQYVLTEYVTNGTSRFTLASAATRVLADLAAASVPLDTRSHARRVLDNIEAWLESKAPTAAKFQLAGRMLENYPLPDLLKLRDRYRAEVRREESGGGRMLVSL